MPPRIACCYMHYPRTMALLIGHLRLLAILSPPRLRSYMESKSPTPSPLLPWEVTKRIIVHSESCDSDGPGRDLKATCNFSLTCRELCAHGVDVSLLVADVAFSNRGKSVEFCAFLRAKSRLKPFVRSIAVDPDDFAPFPVLHILPNLSSLTFVPLVDRQTGPQPAMPLNRSSLTCCRHFGTYIQTLCLTDLIFATHLEFARILSAFTNVAHLVCSKVLIESEGDRTPLEMFKRRISQRLKLITVSVPP